MTEDWHSLVQRVGNSLERDGFSGLKVFDHGEGRVEVVLSSQSPNERALIFAIARSVAGVHTVNVSSSSQ